MTHLGKNSETVAGSLANVRMLVGDVGQERLQEELLVLFGHGAAELDDVVPDANAPLVVAPRAIRFLG
jgi:hypothetical protein